jgi:hypothetical protein
MNHEHGRVEMDREKFIDKVNKLLALGDNNPSEEEAKLAISRARELMAKYEIEETELGKTKSDEAVMRVTPVINSSWVWIMASLITKNMRCKCFYDGGGSKLAFIGIERDLEICIRTFNYVCAFIVREGKRIRKEYRAKGYSTKGVYKSYIMGFHNGLDKMFKEQTDKEKWGLIMQTPAVVIVAMDSIPGLRSRRNSVPGVSDLSAFNRGIEDGKRVSPREALTQ